ncbi:MAG: hypothetical protein U0547_13010 [Dehalococcoidia bacterium]
MGTIWVESVGRSLDAALDLLAAAVRDCPDDAWETPMWPVVVREGTQGLDDARGQRASMPWGIAWHALECLDYDLSGELEPWAPPPPFTGHPHWRDLPRLPRAWTQPEMLGYIEYCRERARATFAGMTEAKAARVLPPAHRYGGEPHAWVIAGFASHTTEHTSQIRQFLSTPGFRH